MHKLILTYHRSLIHFTFLFFSPIKVLIEKFIQAGPDSGFHLKMGLVCCVEALNLKKLN